MHRRWPKFGKEEKHRIIESIVEKITLSNDESDVTWSYLPSSEELTKRQRNLCAMLPFCDRRVTVARKDVAPVWTRSFPIAKEPATLGQHLKKKRFQAGLRQAQIARILKVSCRTLSLWECDRIYPTRAFQSRIIAYLGYDPFTEIGLKTPKATKPNVLPFFTGSPRIHWAEDSAFSAQIPENAPPIGNGMGHQPEDPLGLGNGSVATKLAMLGSILEASFSR